jgi:hypothetical protein
MDNSVENPMEKSGISNLLIPSWHAPSGVHALVTTREHGASMGPWASFNLASHVGDDAAAVAANRAQLRQNLPADPPWLTQVHGTRCVDAARSAIRRRGGCQLHAPARRRLRCAHGRLPAGAVVRR